MPLYHTPALSSGFYLGDETLLNLLIQSRRCKLPAMEDALEVHSRQAATCHRTTSLGDSEDMREKSRYFPPIFDQVRYPESRVQFVR